MIAFGRDDASANYRGTNYRPSAEPIPSLTPSKLMRWKPFIA